MNYYLDFDNTLYETARLTESMLRAITEKTAERSEELYERIDTYVRDNFNSTTDNIFTYAEKIASIYGINPDEIKACIEEVIDNGKGFVFEDAKRFLERLKANGDKAYVLTYVAKGNQEYQMRKLLGSGILIYFEGIIITERYKFLLDLSYKNGIFIDDDPRDLNGLYEQGAKKVIRIKKPTNKRSKLNINNPNIEEYISFDEIRLLEDRGIDF